VFPPPPTEDVLADRRGILPSVCRCGQSLGWPTDVFGSLKKALNKKAELNSEFCNRGPGSSFGDNTDS